jgi:hypothetical protein
MKLLRKLLLLGCGGLLLLVIGGTSLLLPSSWQVSVEQTSLHSAAQLYPLIADFHRWHQWVGWDDQEYGERTIQIEGTAASSGHSYRWSSHSSHGSLTLDRCQPERGIWYQGAIESEQINASGSITLEPLPGGGTLITWKDRGDLPPGTGLPALWMSSKRSAKFAEDLHRLHDIDLSRPAPDAEKPKRRP